MDLLEKINADGVLPEGMKLVDCRKKPLVGQLWGKRHTKSSWKIQSARKEYWFRSIMSIHRWCDKQGYTDFHQGKEFILRDDDVITYTRPKRLCFAVRDEIFYCILPIGKTWRYRKKGNCVRSTEILAPYYSEGKEFIFHEGQLVLDLPSDEARKMLKVIAGTYNWKAEEVSISTLLNYQQNDYPL